VKNKLPMINENEGASNHCWSYKYIFISKYVLSYCFYIHIILLIPISIIQIRFSIVYENQCTIENRIILYLFIIGIIQIIYSFNGILLIIFSLFYEKYQCFNIFLFIGFLIYQILLIFLIIWFIIGSYLVFHIKDEVQYTNSYNTQTYCDYTLYQTSFWTNITYYILIILFSIFLVFRNIKWFIKKLKCLKNNCIKTPIQSE